ncbi:MAG: chorismate mutase [Treponema sp.]|nr:chorismate mutase [Spirochaetia bacterium]MDD7013724.1 chorismate mutase [Spirochaetales bacterium]MDY4903216.1 chorismate mutase [Treponema sp.]
MNAMKLFSIRGACCAENSPESITQEIQTLCSTLFEKNHIKAENIVNIHFTMTPDLDTLNAATALRKSATGIDTSKVPLFVSQEAVIKGMLPKTIRVMVTVYLPEESSPVPVYTNGAQVLRPDFASGN